MDLNIKIIPYALKNKHIDGLKKFHIVDEHNNLINHTICNLFAPFGRQTELDHKTSSNLSQHRLNICFTKEDIRSEKKEYKNLTEIIKKYETYFGLFEELTGYDNMSNIIDRDKYGIVVRFHLKTNKNNTITPLVMLNNTDEKDMSWIDFDKDCQINIKFHPDSFWINEIKKTYGISLLIDKVYQYKI